MRCCRECECVWCRQYHLAPCRRYNKLWHKMEYMKLWLDRKFIFISAIKRRDALMWSVTEPLRLKCSSDDACCSARLPTPDSRLKLSVGLTCEEVSSVAAVFSLSYCDVSEFEINVWCWCVCKRKRICLNVLPFFFGSELLKLLRSHNARIHKNMLHRIHFFYWFIHYRMIHRGSRWEWYRKYDESFDSEWVETLYVGCIEINLFVSTMVMFDIQFIIVIHSSGRNLFIYRICESAQWCFNVLRRLLETRKDRS